MTDFSWMTVVTNLAQIAILTTIFYFILRLLRGTQGIIMLVVVFLVLTATSILVHFLNMEVLDWILKQTFHILPLFLIIIFQNEIRRSLLFIGKHKINVFQKLSSKEKSLAMQHTILEIVDAVCAFTTLPEWKLYQKKNLDGTHKRPKVFRENIGALIAIERNVGLGEYIDCGVSLNAQVDSMLLQSIFYKGGPLHDGGVIIKSSYIVAAATQFPLSQRLESGPTHFRHQAAIGLSEVTDALIILVSEENGEVTLSTHGSILKPMRSPQELTRYLKLYLHTPDDSQQKTGRRGTLFPRKKDDSQ